MSAEPKRRNFTLSPKARKRLKRGFQGIAILTPLTFALTWYAANNVPWFGSWLADALRSVIGTEAVFELEEVAYGLEDRWNRYFRTGESPRSYWDAPSTLGTDSPSPSLEPAAPTHAPSVIPSASATAISQPNTPFVPKEVGPFNAKFAAPGDGVWAAISLPEAPTRAPQMFKTLVHPDAKRPWAEVFVVAIDLSQTTIHSVAGTKEPRGTAPGAREAKRTGLVAETDVPMLIAGFNGGFKEEHGHYGMKIGGILLVRPRADACTIFMTDKGTLRIAPWKAIESDEASLVWWRQTPACLLFNGKLHPGLYDENTNWGAALGGGTVVRRSAAGLSEDGKTLFMAVSNHTSPRTIAIAMSHVGSFHAAQLDINYSYPKFVLFPKTELGVREATSLFEGFKAEKDDYIRQPNLRDFFYVTSNVPLNQ